MRRLAALLVALFVTTACSNEIDTSTRPTSVVGTYQLRSYGGRPLPTQVSSDQGMVMELLSGELVIGGDKTWSETRVYRVTNSGAAQQVSFGSAGSWSFLRDFASMQFNDKALGYQFTGVAAGGSVTLNLNDGNAVIYSH